MESESLVPPERERLSSLDAYRGFVILVMIFVNFIGEMPNIPAWLKHAGDAPDAFTVADLVFPGFLFMVGLAIPLALGKRMLQGGEMAPMLTRIFWRSLGLILAGLMMVNMERYDAQGAWLSQSWYSLLFYLAIILIWRQQNGRRWDFWLGLGLFGFLIFAFKGKLVDGATSLWIEHSWWGILGMIGWAYLFCSLIYLACLGSGPALMGTLAFMIALTMGARVGTLDFLPQSLRGFIGVGELLGSTSANVMVGVLVGNMFREPAPRGRIHLGRLRFMFLFALGLLLAGLLLRPYHGISKVNATESFTLVTSAINLFLFLVFYFVLDVLKWRSWAMLLIPAGANALLAYILPPLWDNFTDLIGLGPLWWHYAWHWLATGGVLGLINAAVVSVFMLVLTVLGGRAGLRLKF